MSINKVGIMNDSRSQLRVEVETAMNGKLNVGNVSL